MSKKAWIKLGFAVGVFIMILCIMLLISDRYKVKNVYVEGNIHYSQEEIQQMVMDGFLGDNSIYLAIKYKNKSVKNIPFIDEMDVNVLSRDTIKISVYEKALAGYVTFLDTLFYFDKDGYVLESSSVKTVGVPQITGLEFDSIVLGQPLPVENNEIFEKILDITKLMNKYELNADKIYFQPSNNITLYFHDIKVALGDEPTWLEDKVMRLPIFLRELEGKNGTLHMEIYEETSGRYSFQPDA